VKWTLDKPMGVASVSKTVTAVAVLKLWEERQHTQHKFSLDEPFWPHIRALCPKAHDDVKRVTIRQLLMHRSGFKKTDDSTSPGDLEKLLASPLAHKPGEVSEYQNNNYYVLRLVLQQISRADYTSYVKAHVLEPMGIKGMETHFQRSAPVCGYLKPGSTRPGFPFDWDSRATAGAAGWFASVSDLGRFLDGLRTHKVLDARTTQMMVQDSLGWDFSQPGCVKGGLWVWDEGNRLGSRAGHLGSVVAHFPDGVDAVLLVNSDPGTDIEGLVVKAWHESREP
jgi:CubicO group peptidase (beta-lactamase class C family)